jgi:hypothetical protein
MSQAATYLRHLIPLKTKTKTKTETKTVTNLAEKLALGCDGL